MKLGQMVKEIAGRSADRGTRKAGKTLLRKISVKTDSGIYPEFLFELVRKRRILKEQIFRRAKQHGGGVGHPNKRA